MGGDAEPHALADRVRDPLSLLVEVGDATGVLAEHFEVHDRAEAELCARDCGGAGKARVGGRRDPAGEACRDAGARDRDVALPVDVALARHVCHQPRAEVETVAEAGVHRVLEMRVRVDETGEDRRVVVRLVGRPELVYVADCGHAPVLERNGAALDRRRIDRKDPVGGENGHPATTLLGAQAVDPPSRIHDARNP
jgi:hypothetical protein